MPGRLHLEQKGNVSFYPSGSPHVRRASGLVDSAAQRGLKFLSLSSIHRANSIQSLMPAEVVKWLWVALGANAFLCRSKGRDTEALSKLGTLSPLSCVHLD